MPVAERNMELIVDDELLTIGARPLWDGRFLCTRSSSLLDESVVFWGDEFEAVAVDEGAYKLVRFIEPSPVVHFQADQGLFLLPHNARTKAAKAEAYKTISNHINDSITTTTLKDFLREHGGWMDEFEFIMCVTLFVHIPRVSVDAFRSALPSLAVGIDPSSLVEVRSGPNPVFEDWCGR